MSIQGRWDTVVANAIMRSNSSDHVLHGMVIDVGVLLHVQLTKLPSEKPQNNRAVWLGLSLRLLESLTALWQFQDSPLSCLLYSFIRTEEYNLNSFLPTISTNIITVHLILLWLTFQTRENI